MSAHLEEELLDALVMGAQADATAQEHLSQCERCARELAWAGAERALFARRSSPPTDHLWSAVAARISKRRFHRPRWALRAGAALAGAAAAALVLLVVRPVKKSLAPLPEQTEAPAPGPDAKTLAALDRAEADYLDAAKVLEDKYARLRPRLEPKLAARWDETLTRARTDLGGARKGMVAQDVNARMRLLDGYAGYLRSLRAAVLQSQEASP